MLPAHLTIETMKQCGPIKVFLDGKLVDKAVEANTAEGWVVKVKQNANGEPIFEGEDFATETLHGVVTAELAEAR